jgi:2-aminophenol/2-amino-5-chlorophenol 1,6-dioxygenase alpha subunit
MSGIVKALMVPGLPQLVFEQSGAGSWQVFRDAMTEAARQVEAVSPEVLVLYSAQWISVLGHSFQYAANPQGLHVDENWHDLGDFPYSFQIDRDLTAAAERLSRNRGLATKLVDYEGFPVDTGTLVALRYFNPDNRLPVVIVSSNIYASAEDTIQLGQAVGEAIRQSGKRAVLINSSLMSHRFLTENVTPETERFSNPQDDGWNRKMLDLLQQGQSLKALEFGPEYVKNAGPEMGFKGFYWMMGAMNNPKKQVQVLAYGSLWGAGAVVLSVDADG